ncbi:delta-delta-dienoyl-CoA isomerase [Paraphysoderma sedebokerense]|nr:delta-delta-dienoyl-CoA isomerase [Paraphysoderma sedebokerense]
MESSSYPSYKTLKTSFPSEYVLHVQLSRERQLNAMNRQFFIDLKDCFDRVKTDSNVRCVILSSSNPKIFTAGLDLKEIGTIIPQDMSDTARGALQIRTLLVSWQESISSVEKCMKPVIAAVCGPCIGVDLITACDIRYSTTSSWFSVKEVDLGLAADIGTLQRLPKVVGNDSAIREWAFTGRKVTVDEAVKVGLLSAVEESRDKLMEKALQTATLIASKSPVAVLGTKHNLNYSRDHTVSDGLEMMASWNQGMLLSSDVMTAAVSSMQKTTAKFPKL